MVSKQIRRIYQKDQLIHYSKFPVGTLLSRTRECGTDFWVVVEQKPEEVRLMYYDCGCVGWIEVCWSLFGGWHNGVNWSTLENSEHRILYIPNQK